MAIINIYYYDHYYYIIIKLKTKVGLPFFWEKGCDERMFLRHNVLNMQDTCICVPVIPPLLWYAGSMLGLLQATRKVDEVRFVLRGLLAYGLHSPLVALNLNLSLT